MNDENNCSIILCVHVTEKFVQQKRSYMFFVGSQAIMLVEEVALNEKEMDKDS